MKKLIKIDLKQKIALLAGTVLLFLLCRPMSQLMMYENVKRYSLTPEILIKTMEDFFLPAVTNDMLPTLLVSILIGVVFFNYLFSKKRVDLYHSIPVDRKHLFISNYVSGLIVYIIALLAESIVGIIIAIPNHYMTATAFKNLLIGMSVNLVEFLFGYSITVFTVMITGKLVVCVLGVLTIFLVFPITGLLINYFTRYFYVTYLEFNIVKPDVLSKYSWLSPFTSYPHFMENFANRDPYGNVVSSYNLAELLLPLALAAVFAFGAYYIYKKRPSEAAGKAIAFKIAQPIVRIPIVILGGFIGTWFMLSSVNEFKTKWMWFGLILGAVLTHCLLEIIFRESFISFFKDKIQLAASIVAAIIIVGIFYGDLTGYDKYLPDIDKIEGVAVYLNGIDSGVSGAEVVEDPEHPGCYISTYYMSEKKPFENPGTSEEYKAKVLELAKIGLANVDKMIDDRKNVSDGIYYDATPYAKDDAVEKAVVYDDDDPMSERSMDEESDESDEDEYTQAKAWMDEMGIVEADPENTQRRMTFEVMYKLKNGKTVLRQYTVPVEEVRASMNEVYSSEEYNSTHFDLYSAVEKNAIHKVEVYDANDNKVCLVTDADAKKFLDAYVKDLKKIDLDTISTLPIGRISPLFKGQYEGFEESYAGYYLYPQFENSLAYLKSIGCDMSGFTSEIKADDVQSIIIYSYRQYKYADGDYLYADNITYTKESNPEMIDLISSQIKNSNNIWSNELLINKSEEGVGIDVTVMYTFENGMQRSVTATFDKNEIPEEVMKDIAVKIWKDQKY